MVLPSPASRRWRRWGWWRRRRRSPVMRRRRWRRWHTPAMPMMMAVGDAARFVSAWLRHCRPRECDCGKRRDYLHLVHVVVPFFTCGYVFASDRSADKPSYESAKERSPDFAPVLRVESAVVVMLRLVMHCRRRRSRSVAHNLMPRFVLRVGGVVLCRLSCRSGGLCRVRLLRRCFHRRWSLASGWRISLRCSVLAPLDYPLAPYGSLGPHCVRRVRHRGSAKCAANRQRNHHLLYCLVHCRVPFVFAQAHSRAYTELGRFASTF